MIHHIPSSKFASHWYSTVYTETDNCTHIVYCYTCIMDFAKENVFEKEYYIHIKVLIDSQGLLKE